MNKLFVNSVFIFVGIFSILVSLYFTQSKNYTKHELNVKTNKSITPKVISIWASDFVERGGILFWKVYTIYRDQNDNTKTVISEYNAFLNGTYPAKLIVNSTGRDADYRLKIQLGLIEKNRVVGSQLKFTGQGKNLKIWEDYFNLNEIRLEEPVFTSQYELK